MSKQSVHANRTKVCRSAYTDAAAVGACRECTQLSQHLAYLYQCSHCFAACQLPTASVQHAGLDHDLLAEGGCRTQGH